MNDETRKSNPPERNRDDVRKLDIGPKSEDQGEFDLQLKWINGNVGKSSVVHIEGRDEEWKVYGPKTINTEKGTSLEVVVTKRVEGKVSSFEISVEELQKMNLNWQ